MQKKIKIDFDPNDKEKILHILERQQNCGYALKDVGEISGIMTFESTYETMRYAIRKKKLYKKQKNQIIYMILILILYSNNH